MAAGIGPTFPEELIRACAVVSIPPEVLLDEDVDEVAAFLEGRGDLYRVDAGWTSVLPEYRRNVAFLWAPMGSTFKGRALPPLGSEAPHEGPCDPVPLDAYKARCLRCGGHLRGAS